MKKSSYKNALAIVGVALLTFLSAVLVCVIILTVQVIKIADDSELFSEPIYEATEYSYSEVDGLFENAVSRAEFEEMAKIIAENPKLCEKAQDTVGIDITVRGMKNFLKLFEKEEKDKLTAFVTKYKLDGIYFCDGKSVGFRFKTGNGYTSQYKYYLNERSAADGLYEYTVDAHWTKSKF